MPVGASVAQDVQQVVDLQRRSPGFESSVSANSATPAAAQNTILGG